MTDIDTSAEANYPQTLEERAPHIFECIETVDVEYDFNSAAFARAELRDIFAAFDAMCAERDALLRVVTDNHAALCRAEEAEKKLAKAVEALRLVTDACDEGQMASMGAGGMTIDAQIRRSVYNKVPAWPIEEARTLLAELGKTE